MLLSYPLELRSQFKLKGINSQMNSELYTSDPPTARRPVRVLPRTNRTGQIISRPRIYKKGIQNFSKYFSKGKAQQSYLNTYYTLKPYQSGGGATANGKRYLPKTVVKKHPIFPGLVIDRNELKKKPYRQISLIENTSSMTNHSLKNIAKKPVNRIYGKLGRVSTAMDEYQFKSTQNNRVIFGPKATGQTRTKRTRISLTNYKTKSISCISVQSREPRDTLPRLEDSTQSVRKSLRTTSAIPKRTTKVFEIGASKTRRQVYQKNAPEVSFLKMKTINLPENKIFKIPSIFPENQNSKRVIKSSRNSKPKRMRDSRVRLYNRQHTRKSPTSSVISHFSDISNSRSHSATLSRRVGHVRVISPNPSIQSRNVERKVVNEFRIVDGMSHQSQISVNESANLWIKQSPGLSRNVSIEGNGQNKLVAARFKDFKFKKYIVKDKDFCEKAKENKKSEKSDLKSKLRKVHHKELHKNVGTQAKKGVSFYRNPGLRIAPNVKSKILLSPRMKKSRRVQKLTQLGQKAALSQRPIARNFIFSPVLKAQPQNGHKVKANGTRNELSMFSPKPSLERSQKMYNLSNGTWTGSFQLGKSVKNQMAKSNGHSKLVENGKKKSKKDKTEVAKKIKQTLNGKIIRVNAKREGHKATKIGPKRLYAKLPAKQGKACHFISQSASNLKELLQKYNKSQEKNQYQLGKQVNGEKPTVTDDKGQGGIAAGHTEHTRKDVERSVKIRTKLLERVKNIDGTKRNSRDRENQRESRMKDSLMRFIQKEQKQLESNTAHNRSRSNVNLKPDRLNRFEHMPPVSYGSYKRPNKSILRKSKQKKYS